MYVGMYERANIILYNLRECLHTNIRSSYCLLFECSAAAAMATGKHQQLLTLIVQCFRWMVAVEIPYNSGDAKWASGGNYFTCCCHKPSTNIRCQPLTLLRKCSATDTSCTNGCTSLRSFWCDGWRVACGVWRVGWFRFPLYLVIYLLGCFSSCNVSVFLLFSVLHFPSTIVVFKGFLCAQLYSALLSRHYYYYLKILLVLYVLFTYYIVIKATLLLLV